MTAPQRRYRISRIWWMDGQDLEAVDEAAAAAEHVRQAAEKLERPVSAEPAGPRRYLLTTASVWEDDDPWTDEIRVTLLPDQSRRGLDEGAAVEHVRVFLTRTLVPAGTAGLFVREFPLFTPLTQPSHPEAVGPTGRSDLAFLPRWTGHGAPVRQSLGVEIKTRNDTLTRLPDQAAKYDRLFGRCLLAATPEKLRRVQEGEVLPGHWGLLELDPEDHTVTGWVRRPAPTPGAALEVRHLGEPLWRDEVHALVDQALEAQGHHRRRRTLNGANRTRLWAEARTLIGDAALWNQILDRLHARVHQVRLATWAVPGRREWKPGLDCATPGNGQVKDA